MESAKLSRNLFIRSGRWGYRCLGISCRQRYANRQGDGVMPAEEANRRLADVVLAGKPCMVSRLGTSEAVCILNFLEIEARRSVVPLRRAHAILGGASETWDASAVALLTNNAGFFPATDECLTKFARLFLEDLRVMDWTGVWGFVPGESLLINRYCPSAVRFEPTAVEPYSHEPPWSAHLEGRRVLVIHPFAETIRAQFAHRAKLFTNPLVLPDFELLTIPAVQSLAGNKTDFASWFHALDWMKSEVDKLDFDVALIGAGAYGLPLSAHVKRRGKIAIHMGGSLQILFGIRGRRWDNMPHISQFYNENWVRPSDAERLPAAEKVEQGCYW